MLIKRIIGIIFAFLSAIGFADDTDMYRADPITSPAKIMLVLDTSGSMNSELSDCDDTVFDYCDMSKLELAKSALKDFLILNDDATNADIIWGDDVEIGFAGYTKSNIGNIRLPVRALGDVYALNDAGEAKTHRQHLIDEINELDAGNNTPLLRSYLENIHYLLGKNSAFYPTGYTTAAGIFSDKPEYAGIPQNQCVNRVSLVMLTDGLSVGETLKANTGWKNDDDTNVKFFELLELFIDDGTPSDYVCDIHNSVFDKTDDDEIDTDFWTCTNTVADALFKNHAISTHVIAYNLDDEAGAALSGWATNGGGFYRSADSAAELSSAFSDIIGNAETVSQSFTAVVPGVTVNPANRFTFLDDIYFSVFKPTDKKLWYGNLKKYSLEDFLDGDVVNNVTGFFKDTARSDWLALGEPDDGGDIYLGGSAGEIPSNYLTRKLYVSLSGESNLLEIGTTTLDTCPAEVATSTTGLCVVRDHFFEDYLGTDWADGTGWTPDSNLLHSAYAVKVGAMLEWLRGNDVFNELGHLKGVDTVDSRKLYGSPLHAPPVIINYTAFGANFAPIEESAQENLVLVSTNDGKLYAIDSNTGAEKLAYMPAAMFDRLSGSESTVEQLYDAATFAATESGGEGDLIYGLDTAWSVWRQDMNKDGNITTSGSNDFVYMYGGMRRGGRDYIALDVTDTYHNATIDELFVIRGGVAGTETEEIGQTWSKPTLGIIRYKDAAIPVMFVGGGYDTGYDSDTSRPSDPLGAQIYMIVARDVSHANGVSYSAGDILWWASSDASGVGEHVQFSDLKHSIPSEVRVLDSNNDGYINHLYFGDLGGQLHRFDLNYEATNASQLVTANVVAQLGVEATGATSVNGDGDAVFDDDRRFYHAPSIAVMSEQADGGKQKYVAIALGSGWRANPNSDVVDDQFFYIKDREPFTEADVAVIQYNALHELAVVDEDGSTVSGSEDVTEIPSGTLGVRAPLLLDGEKMISTPLIIAGSVFSTTYYQRSAAETLEYLAEINDEIENEDDRLCSAIPGAAALYAYTPGSGGVTQAEVNLNQSAAGGITTVLSSLLTPGDSPGNGDGGDDTDSDKSDVDAIIGTHSFNGLPPVDFSNIRKTEWLRKKDDDN